MVETKDSRIGHGTKKRHWLSSRALASTLFSRLPLTAPSPCSVYYPRMSRATNEPPGDLSGSTVTSSHSCEATKQERRRCQNRHKQRTWRERQRLRREAERLAEEHALQQQSQDQVAALILDLTQHPSQVPDLGILAARSQSQEKSQFNDNAPIATNSCLLPHPRLYRLLTIFEAAAYQSSQGNPQADHLLTLAKLNVFRAFVRSIAVLGYTREWMTDNALSRFSISGPHPASLPAEKNIPASLRPTELQQTQPHHPWLDFFPFARLRDNRERGFYGRVPVLPGFDGVLEYAEGGELYACLGRSLGSDELGNYGGVFEEVGEVSKEVSGDSLVYELLEAGERGEAVGLEGFF
ncbi:hypothetical protein BDV12DRAFT_126603 [Aspergillus spectabilis]